MHNVHVRDRRDTGKKNLEMTKKYTAKRRVKKLAKRAYLSNTARDSQA